MLRNSRFCKFVSGPVVGVQPTSVRQSHTTAKPRATPKPTRPSPRTGLPVFGMVRSSARRWYPSEFRRPTHLALRVANLNRRCGPSHRWASNAQSHRKTDDDSRYRFASYELPEPEHSRRGRPSSPCPAVAGAKPRDDGLRVASRLPPRSRLGAVMNRA